MNDIILYLNKLQKVKFEKSLRASENTLMGGWLRSTPFSASGREAHALQEGVWEARSQGGRKRLGSPTAGDRAEPSSGGDRVLCGSLGLDGGVGGVPPCCGTQGYTSASGP